MFDLQKKKVEPTSFLQVLRIFLFNAWLGTGTSYTRNVDFQNYVHPHTFHQSSGTKCCKTAYHKIPFTKTP